MSALTPVFTIRVQMLSDWIVGTGEGRVGDVDATVRRDSSGLPFVPAKTLTGMTLRGLVVFPYAWRRDVVFDGWVGAGDNQWCPDVSIRLVA